MTICFLLILTIPSSASGRNLIATDTIYKDGVEAILPHGVIYQKETGNTLNPGEMRVIQKGRNGMEHLKLRIQISIYDDGTTIERAPTIESSQGIITEPIPEIREIPQDSNLMKSSTIVQTDVTQLYSNLGQFIYIDDYSLNPGEQIIENEDSITHLTNSSSGMLLADQEIYSGDSLEERFTTQKRQILRPLYNFRYNTERNRRFVDLPIYRKNPYSPPNTQYERTLGFSHNGAEEWEWLEGFKPEIIQDPTLYKGQVITEEVKERPLKRIVSYKFFDRNTYELNESTVLPNIATIYDTREVAGRVRIGIKSPIATATLEKSSDTSPLGKEYGMPKVNIQLEDGTKEMVEVEWSTAVDVHKKGETLYKGKINGWEEEFSFTLTITDPVLEKVELAENTKTVKVGEKVELPKTVKGIYTDKTTKDLEINWTPNAVDTKKDGKFIFKGKVEGFAEEILYTLTVEKKAGGGTSPTTPTETVKPIESPGATVKVIGGADRIETAVLISKASYEKADTVVLATSENYPDSLVAGPYAKAMDSPILLTRKGNLDPRVLGEIKRLGTKNIHIIGGVNALNQVVENQLKSLGYIVERIAGEDRYETAIHVAEKVQEKFGPSKSVFLATGENYPDAIAASAAAAKEGLPVVLTRKGQLPKVTKDALAKWKTEKTTLFGGNNAIGETVAKELQAASIKVDRIGGSDRYETSALIAKNFFPKAEKAVLTTGLNFPDALAGAPYAAKNNAPILLVRQKQISKAVEDYIKERNIKYFNILGSENAVSSQIIKK